MKILRAFPVLILMLCLSSCSMPLTVSLFNNSPIKIEVIFDSQKVVILPGTTQEIVGIEDRNITIMNDNKTYSYDVASTYYANFEFVGRGPFKKRMFFAQFEADGKIWATNQWLPRPARAFQKQPEGFPLVPSS